MKHYIFRTSPAQLVAVFFAVLTVFADFGGGIASVNAGVRPVGTVARELLSTHGDAIVTLRVVTEVTMTVTDRPSQSEELTIEVPGTVVNSKGVVIASHYRMQPQTPTTERDGIEVSFAYETKEVRILWGDGEESPGRIVFTDEDFDLSMIRPDEDKEGVVAVDFMATSAGLEPQLLDEVIMLARQDESIDRVLRIETGRISALIERPRRMFVSGISEPGVPAFHEGGGILGLFALKVVEGQAPAPVIRPAADVAKALQSALARAGITAEGSESTSTGGGSDDAIADVGRELLEEFQESIVSLFAVTERSGRTQEVWSVGVVVGSDGLIATSRTGLARSDVKEVKIVLGDGSELAATMVLEDLDLDLAFIQPNAREVEEQGVEFFAFPFKTGSPAVELQIADPVVILTRESPAFFRQPKLILTHVDSVIERPRRYYRTPGKQAGALGFTGSGELIGIYARRVTGEETRHRMLLPVEHVIEAAERARKAALETPEETEPVTEPVADGEEVPDTDATETTPPDSDQ